MKQAFLSNKNISLREVEIPALSPKQILVRTAGCGVCEGDLFRYNDSQGREEAMPFGHEASGIVEKVGSCVSAFKPGDRVSSMDGGYAEFFISDEDNLALVPDGIPLESALGEPLACCVHAAEKFNIRLGDRVAVIGCGYMGLASLQLALLRGASQVLAVDLMPWRLKDALVLGADRALNARDIDPENLPEELKDFDVVIEATGAPAPVKLGTKLLRFHGTLNLVGYHQSDDGMRHIDMKEWNFKSLNVINGHVRDLRMKKEAMEIALRLSAGGKLKTDSLVTDYAFADIGRAFEDLAARKEGLYKANIVF